MDWGSVCLHSTLHTSSLTITFHTSSDCKVRSKRTIRTGGLFAQHIEHEFCEHNVELYCTVKTDNIYRGSVCLHSILHMSVVTITLNCVVRSKRMDEKGGPEAGGPFVCTAHCTQDL